MRPGERSERVAAIATLAALKGMTTPHSGQASGFVLRARDIGDEFGFYDGGITYPNWELLHDWYHGDVPFAIDSGWHAVLWRVVHEHLIPEIVPRLEMAGAPMPHLSYAETTHNPVRFADAEVDPAILPDLTVHVPWLVVLAHCVVEIDSRLATQDPTPDPTPDPMGGAIGTTNASASSQGDGVGAVVYPAAHAR